MMVLILIFIFHVQAQHITQLEFLQKLRNFKIQIQKWNFKMCEVYEFQGPQAQSDELCPPAT